MLPGPRPAAPTVGAGRDPPGIFMKVAIDGRLIDQTGVGRYAKNLFNQLKRFNKRNEYILIKPKFRWHSLAEQVCFPFWLLKKNFNLVHFTYFSFPLFYPGKFVLTIHDLIPWRFKTGRASSLPGLFYKIKHFCYKMLLFIGARKAEKIIAVSKTTKKEIVRCLKVSPEKIVVIYEGVDSKFKKRKPATSYQLPATSYLLYVGNAYPHKNLERLIEAFNKFKIKNDKFKIEIQNLKLLFVGPEDYFYERLKKTVEKSNLEEKIIFYGAASDKELVSLYKNALCFINPSLMEGFGLPGLEAMSLGCPVVCSNIPVFREIYGRAAFYFDPKDIGNISRKINKFLKMNKKEKEKLIKLGKEQTEKYSWRKCAERTLEVYESCFGL